MSKRERVEGIRPYHKPAGGWGSLWAAARAIRGQMDVGEASRALLRSNKPDGFDCPGCPWPDKEKTSTQFDFEKALWTVPAARTKMGRDHVVPLSKPALAIVAAQRQIYSGDLIFPGRGGSPFSSVAARDALRRLGEAVVTLHGFRSLAADVLRDKLTWTMRRLRLYWPT
jgi:hypothetical protein